MHYYKYSNRKYKRDDISRDIRAHYFRKIVAHLSRINSTSPLGKQSKLVSVENFELSQLYRRI